MTNAPDAPTAQPNAVSPSAPTPIWLIGLLLFLWLLWLGFLIWAGRNDWSRTRPVDTPAPENGISTP